MGLKVVVELLKSAAQIPMPLNPTRSMGLRIDLRHAFLIPIPFSLHLQVFFCTDLFEEKKQINIGKILTFKFSSQFCSVS